MRLAGERDVAESISRVYDALQQLNPADVEKLVHETEDLQNVDPLVTIAELAQQEPERWHTPQNTKKEM